LVTRPTEDEEFEDRPPSKSQRKRDAHAAQDLGVTLIGLRDSELEALNLPERLVDAIRAARTVSSRGGGARQRQYIGKLMRDIDPEPIRAALGAHSEKSALETQRFKRLEAWRERLLVEGAAALDELERWRPGLDRAQWMRRISAALSERERKGPGTASRELFRALRELFAQEATDTGETGQSDTDRRDTDPP
jgi:ribosome-associated protein